jgi:hypothetical protein
MFTLNDDLSIYATRGDIVFFSVSAEEDGKSYKFQAGDVVRIKVFGKKDCEAVVLQKDFPVTEVCENVEIFLTEEDTKIGEVISKPKDYWYEVELNPGDNPQTIIGYDEDGAKVFKLFPEGDDIPEFVPDPEDFRVMDDELDMTSTRPVQNQAIARAFMNLQAGYEATHAAVAEKFVTPQMYGAVGDGEADDTESFKAAIATGHPVYVPTGEYLVGELEIDTNCTIYGDPKNMPTICCAGIILNAQVFLSGLLILPSGSYAGTGILVKKGGCNVENCILYSFNIGLELCPVSHVVSGVFKGITIGYCRHAGVKAVASGNGQNNQIMFEHLYIVKCGIDADNDTSESTKLVNGFGMYIDGGYAVEIRNCVFEYNSGVGLYLAQSYPLNGCTVTTPYFEHNKYAQLYVANATGTYMKNVHVSGDFYSDAGRGLPVDSLSNRGLYIENNGNLKVGASDQGNYFSSESAKAYGYANRYCPENVFPYDVIGELKNPNFAVSEYGGETVWTIPNGGVTLYGCPVYLEKGDYIVTIEATASANSTFVFGLTGHPDGSKTWTCNAPTEWTTNTRTISATQRGSCYLYCSNSTANIVRIKDIRIVRA